MVKDCDFSDFFLNSTAQPGMFLEITPVDGLCFFLRKVENGCNKMVAGAGPFG